MIDAQQDSPSLHGLQRLFGQKAFEQLIQKHVLVVGIGGVGSWVCESLIRSGVHNITMVDLDDICVTNINRQVHALHSTVGQSKIEVMKKRMLEINPDANIQLIHDFYDPATSSDILKTQYDLVIDCIDSLSNKCHLLHACRERRLSVITVGGAGGKIDPTLIRTNDLGLSTNDTLLKRTRKLLKRQYGWRDLEGDTWDIQAVYSIERTRFVHEDGELRFVPNDKRNQRIDCQTGLGTASFVTGAMGFHATSLAIQMLIPTHVH